MQILTPNNFKVMEQSFVDETADMPDDVGISVALWRLKALMAGYRWALDNGMTGVTIEDDIGHGA